MEYARLGATGLEVSRICLGCMSFGAPDRGAHSWTMDATAARPYFERALEAGINFFDTANSYSAGSSEEITGKVLGELADRDDIVLATKVRYGSTRQGPNSAGLSRKTVMAEVEGSLRRLGTDYLDLYQIHRWDHATPIEETLQALDDLVRSGKVRYLGASSMAAWQFAKALYTADAHGWTRFVSMQNHHNLLYREEEREMVPLCLDQGVGLIPWSPLARGRLARPWDETTTRSATDEFGRTLYLDSDRVIAERVQQVAGERGVPMAQVALAWLLAQPGITAPILGVTRMQHLDDGIAAVDLRLSAEEVALLEEPYQPHGVVGF